MRVVARVAQHEFVELAGFEAQLARNEFMLAGLAEIDRDRDWLLAREIAGGVQERDKACESDGRAEGERGEHRGGMRRSQIHEFHGDPPWKAFAEGNAIANELQFNQKRLCGRGAERVRCR